MGGLEGGGLVNSEEGERKADTAEMAVFPQQSCYRVALPLLGLDLGKRSIFKPHIYPTVAYSNIYFGEGHFKGMEYPPTPLPHLPGTRLSSFSRADWIVCD